jgi:hypothetical protein
MSMASLMESVALSLERPVGTQDTAGGTIQNFALIWKNYYCSCQQASPRIQELYAQRNVAVDTTLYFARDPQAQINDRITVKDRVATYTFLVTGGNQTSFGRGVVWQVHCFRIQEPVSVNVVIT